MFWRSKQIFEKPLNSFRRSLYKSVGFTDNDFEKPIIGIANSWTNLMPGHLNLRDVSEHTKKGIYESGGTVVEFGVPAACDAVANGHIGMKYILPSRDLIAASIECVVQAHQLDGIVLLGSCDKIVPGMLMAAARLDIPAILVPGGPSEGGCQFDNRKSDITSVYEAYGMLTKGKITQEAFDALEDEAMPSCGSCSFLGTANTMCIISEALGLSIPYAGTALATSAQRMRIANESGRAIMAMVANDITARKILKREAFDNAIRVTMAIGGSTNAALHIPAIAYDAEIALSLDDFDDLSKKTPYIARLNPSGPNDLSDFHHAGGVPAILKSLKPLLNQDCMTASGLTIGQIADAYPNKNPDIIKSIDNPVFKEGGLKVMRGNIAPDGAVIKPAGVDPKMWKFTGRARVFESEEDANAALRNGEIEKGDTIVIRYEGPKGGPGMREMASMSKLLYGLGLNKDVALITDGRFSGTNNGCFVGHISPEAAEGGPLAIVQDGDLITIDIDNQQLDLQISPKEIADRLKKWKRPTPSITKGFLSIYSKIASSASEGAVLK
jgi:dihydroxy-acid dehydratase